MPTRLTVDLFRAARCVATAVSVRVVRDGRRVRSAECDVSQEGRLVARATCCNTDDRRRRRGDCGPCRYNSISAAAGSRRANGSTQRRRGLESLTG